MLPDHANACINVGRLGPLGMGQAGQGGDGPTPNPFIPHLLDFWTNEKGLTNFTTTFNVTGPNVVVEMFFLYTGSPSFVIRHGADILRIAAVQINEAEGIGCLIALGESVTTEIAALTVTATGGTFGGIFGRIRTLDYRPVVAWHHGLSGIDKQTHALTGPVSGEVVGVSIWRRGYSDSGKFTNLDVQARTRILDGEPVPYTTSPVEAPWTEVAPGIYEIDTPNRPVTRKLFDFTFDQPIAPPLYWDFGATANPGGITYSGIGDVTQNNNWTTGVVVGANITQEQSRYNTIYTGATLTGYGTCRVGNFRFYSNPTPYGCSIYRSAGRISTDYRNSTGEPWAALAVCLVPEGSWLPFTMTAGDTGDWIGYTSGDIATPPFNPPMGTISNEPQAAHALEALYVSPDGGEIVAIFHGDIQALANGMTITVDGYTGEASDISMLAGNTVVRFSPPFGQFVDGQTYGVFFSPGDE